MTPFFDPHAGGVESYVREITNELARRGHELTVVTSRYDPRLPAEERRDGYRVLRTRTLGVVYNTPLDVGTTRTLRGLDADVVHVHYPPPFTSYFAARALRRRAVPLVMTYHCDLYLPGLLGRVLTGLYERLLLPATLRRVDQVIVHTRSYGVTSAPLRGRRLTIIPSTVDVHRFRPDLDGGPIRRRLGLEGKRVIEFTGRLVPHKGVDLVLRTLPGLPSDVALVVVGRGPRLEGLRALARRLGVEERVRFCPDVPDDALPSYLRVADLFVFPSQNRLEGFGLVVAEAMASGLPVVIADMPGVREVIEPGREGLLVEPLLGSDLAARLRELLDDPARRRAMGDAARRRAEERYSLETVVGSLIRTYEARSAAGSPAP